MGNVFFDQREKGKEAPTPALRNSDASLSLALGGQPRLSSCLRRCGRVPRYLTCSSPKAEEAERERAERERRAKPT